MESIYNLVPREYVEPPKAPMHRSHHDPSQNLTGSTFGCRGSTRLPGAGVVDKREGSLFGPHKTLPPYKSTTNRLTKSGANTLSGSGEFHHCEGERKAAVPKRTERPVLGITSNKNYITANAVEAILMGKFFSLVSALSDCFPPFSASEYNQTRIELFGERGLWSSSRVFNSC
jgi:hypothetical protein